MKFTLTLVLSSYLLIACADTRAVTVEELRAVENLTPEKFASFFSGFQFVFRAEVQPPEVFLATQAGDCDDFATLAAKELTERGYTTRLIAVRMKKETHVICYVQQAHGYLDYNLRAKGGLVPCGPELGEIADSVVKSFKNAAWTSTSEFTYGEGVKRLVKTSLPGMKMASSSAPSSSSSRRSNQ